MGHSQIQYLFHHISQTIVSAISQIPSPSFVNCFTKPDWSLSLYSAFLLLSIYHNREFPDNLIASFANVQFVPRKSVPRMRRVNPRVTFSCQATFAYSRNFSESIIRSHVDSKASTLDVQLLNYRSFLKSWSSLTSRRDSRRIHRSTALSAMCKQTTSKRSIQETLIQCLS